jgi:hypothetical protein
MKQRAAVPALIEASIKLFWFINIAELIMSPAVTTP